MRSGPDFNRKINVTVPPNDSSAGHHAWSEYKSPAFRILQILKRCPPHGKVNNLLFRLTEVLCCQQFLRQLKRAVFHVHVRAQELCESRGGRPGLLSLINLRFLWTSSNTSTNMCMFMDCTSMESYERLVRSLTCGVPSPAATAAPLTAMIQTKPTSMIHTYK